MLKPSVTHSFPDKKTTANLQETANRLSSRNVHITPYRGVGTSDDEANINFARPLAWYGPQDPFGPAL